jgi:hypothetical protein
MTRLIDDLDALHARFVESVNLAIEEDDLARADRLAAEYDDEAISMIARHEGRTDQLSLRRPTHADSGLRARIRRFTHHRAA